MDENIELLKKAATATLEEWAVMDLGSGYACIGGNVHGDKLGRFADGDFIRTSKFKLKKPPEKFKEGDLVETQNNIYLLGAQYVRTQDTVVQVTGVSGKLGEA
jgi:hypothetical protein